tara:strand:+ start:2083 stop:2472 length:390 start_codon:yes stop_codon:yes gene_type:complete
MDRMDKESKNMNLVFELEHVICSPNADYNLCKPVVNVTEFMQWLKKEGHHITIWTKRFNDLGTKLKTEEWLKIHQISYDRLIFDRPRNAIFVDETPSNCKYLGYNDDVIAVAALFEEWKKEITKEENDR